VRGEHREESVELNPLVDDATRGQKRLKRWAVRAEKRGDVDEESVRDEAREEGRLIEAVG